MQRSLHIFVSMFLCVVVFGWMAAPQVTNALVPFGGRILTYTLCNSGAWVTVGPPRGGSFMYVPGTISYLYGPPTHTAQLLLGRAGPPMVCFVGPNPVGAGLIMLFHGSSAL